MMKLNGWKRNLRLKIGSVLAALLATLGFYGLIQAHPLTHVAATPAGDTAPAVSGSSSANGSSPFAQPAAAADNGGSAFSQAAAPAPVASQPHTRTRTS